MISLLHVFLLNFFSFPSFPNLPRLAEQKNAFVRYSPVKASRSSTLAETGWRVLDGGRSRSFRRVLVPEQISDKHVDEPQNPDQQFLISITVGNGKNHRQADHNPKNLGQ
jgi:hypothetical protein